MQRMDVEANKTSELFSASEQNSPIACASAQNPTSHTDPKSLHNSSKIERLQQSSRSLGNNNKCNNNDNNNNNNNTCKTSASNINQENETPISYWNYKQTGVKSRPIKILKHPIEHIERKIILTYLLGFLFKLIAIISGPIIVLVVVLITLPFIVIRRLIWFLLNLRCISDARICTHNHSSNQLNIDDNYLNWRYCPLSYLEAYWFKEKLVNTIILVIDQQSKEEFSIESLRCLMRENVLSKPIFKKFLSSVVAKGIPYYKSYYWKYLGEINDTIVDTSGTKTSSPQSCSSRELSTSSEESIDSTTKSDALGDDYSNNSTNLTGRGQVDFHIKMPSDLDQHNNDFFCINNHIYLDDCLKDTGKDLISIRNYAYQLLDLNLNVNRPLWELRAIPTSKKRTYLIFRCHQSLADGRSLAEILKKHLTSLSSSHAEDDDGSEETSSENNLKILKEKESFISKFGEFSGLRSAILIGPLTILLWIIWSFTRRKNNHLNRYKSDKYNLTISNRRRFHITSYDLTKFFQIKQMTRSTVSDIILCALSGSLREYLRKFNGVSNPPNLNISLSVDMSEPEYEKHIPSGQSDQTNITESSIKVPQVNCTLLNVPLPTSVEGAVPRLWELRNTMEELRTSADPWVMVGLQQFLYAVIPLSWYQWFINRVALRNSSAIVSNMRGPQNMVESWCVDLFQRAVQESQQPPQVVQQDQLTCYQGDEAIKTADKMIKKVNSRFKRKTRLYFNGSTSSVSEMYYCLQPPTSGIPISFNCITYQNRLFITILTRSMLVEDSKLLSQLFFKQLNQLAQTIAKRKSLITIVRSTIPIEINYRPASPIVAKEESILSGITQETKVEFSEPFKFEKYRRFRPLSYSDDDVEVDFSNENMRETCKTCSKSKCTCKRRRSLANLDLKSRSILQHSPNSSQLNVPRLDKSDGSKKTENAHFEECICGQQLLHDLDEEKSVDEMDDKPEKEVTSNSSLIIDEYTPKQRYSNAKLCCKKCLSVTKQSTTSLNDSSRLGRIWIDQTRSGSNNSFDSKEQASCEVSTQLVIPKKGPTLPKAHSKSETDLLPVVRNETNTCSSCSRDSWFSLKKFAIFSKVNMPNQRPPKARASIANIQYDGKVRNLIELPAEVFHKRYIEKSTKRRQSIATSTGCSHVNRTIVVKDEINADVNLRYQLDRPFNVLQKRRSSTVGSEKSDRRRASLIPFGFMHNQSFPKHFSEEGEAHL